MSTAEQTLARLPSTPAHAPSRAEIEVAAEIAAKTAARREARQNFHACLRDAYRALVEAERIAILKGLGDTAIAQARAAAGIAGAEFYAIHGTAEAEDFLRLRDDLEHIASKIDPLIEAIGEEAKYHAPIGSPSLRDFDDCFKGVIAKAIDGEATSILERCAETQDENDAEPV